jgi:hypothetical protein
MRRSVAFVRWPCPRAKWSCPREKFPGVRCLGIPSTRGVPCLRYVRGQPSFDAGTNVVPAPLGRNPDELENSEDCGSAGGHGNQHVRLRGASIDASKRSARLRQQLVAAGRASRPISRKFSTACVNSKAWIPPKGRQEPKGRRKAIRSRFLSVQSAFKAFPWLADGPGIMLGYMSSADSAGLAGSTP